MMNIKFSSRFKKHKAYLAFFLLCVAVFAYMAHMQVILNADVASLLHDTRLFLSGGTYVKDFFETNPPMIFILYTPIIILHKLTSFNIKSLTCFYVIFLSFISLAFCYVLVKRILFEGDFYLRNAIIFMLICTFLFVPMSDFGQREHLLFILGMPYLLAAVVRAKNITVSVMQAGLIGLMAGLVFSLKPFFLIPIILIEFYLMVVRKNLWSWVRVESLVMLCVMVLYIVYVLIYHPLYFNVLMPLISQFYFIGTEENWHTIFSKPRVIFCFVIAAMYCLFFYQKNRFRELSQVLFLSLIGFILAFIVPRSAWMYHVLPAYSMALLLTVIYVYSIWSEEITQNLLKKKEAIFIIAVSFAMPIVIFAEEVFQVIQLSQIKSINALKSRVKTMPYHSIYCFSSITTGLCFPLVTMNNKEFAGRFPMLWWIRGLRKMENTYGDQSLPVNMIRDKNFLIDSLAYDLNHYKPELIIAYKGDEKLFLPEGDDYPAYFSKRENFKMAWSHYQWLDDIGPFRLYRRTSLA